MLYTFIGQMGGGKTVTAVKIAYFCQQKYGQTVYSNIGLNFPHIKFTRKVFQELMKDKTKLQNVIILLDEMHVYFDSRSSMSKQNKQFSYFVNQTRKRNVTILGTTQSWRLVDVRYRQRVHKLTYCRNVSAPDAKVVTILCETVDPNEDHPSAPIKTQYVANPYFPLYDTNEIVDFTEEEEDA